MKNILITGAFGYLGGRIALELSFVQNLKLILGSRSTQTMHDRLFRAKTVAIDMLDSGTLSKAVEGVQEVIHLAAMNANECFFDPCKAVLVNTLGTLNILQASIDAGVERFTYFSTAHVYGTSLAGHITEEILPRPVHPYAITHYSAENFVLAAHTQEKITGTVLRLSNGLGAPALAGVNCWMLLVNDLCRQAVETHKLVLNSNGLQQRDFITLKDVGRAAAHLISLPKNDCLDGLFNLGGKESVSVWEMAQRIAQRCHEKLGFLPDIERRKPSGNYQPEKLHYDCEKFCETGFELEGLIDDAIDETLLFCVEEQERI